MDIINCMGFLVEQHTTGIKLRCRHDILHPSSKLRNHLWKPADALHCCDGCCTTTQFTDAEDLIYKIEMDPKQDPKKGTNNE